MSQFKHQYTAARLGTLSQESSEVDLIPEHVNPEAITVQDVQEVREEREQIQEVNEAVVEVAADVQAIKETGSATSVVVTASDMAATVSPLHSDNFVALANESFKSSALILGTPIPSLEVAVDGSVTDLSQEALGEWFKSALPAFSEAGKRFFGRIVLSFRQMSTSNKALSTRLTRVKVKMGSRRGAGGKHLKLSAGTRFQLIKGDGYSGTLAADLQAHWDLTEKAVAILLEYETRMAEHIKKRIVEAISNGGSTNFVEQVDAADLVKRFETLTSLSNQLLGNRKLAQEPGHRGTQILSYTIINGMPDATVLAKSLDSPISLTNDEINMLAGDVQRLIANQLSSLDETVSRVEDSFSGLWHTLDRLNNNWTHDAQGRVQYQSLGHEVNAAELLRLENDLLEELGEIGERLAKFQLLAVNQVDAVLILMEESIFQD